MSDEAKAFILGLDDKLRKKVAYNIQKSRKTNDPRLLKKITNDIWEFRTRFRQTQIRLLAFWDSNKKSFIVSSHGFIKKTSKTPKTEILKAEEFRKHYLKGRL